MFGMMHLLKEIHAAVKRLEPPKVEREQLTGKIVQLKHEIADLQIAKSHLEEESNRKAAQIKEQHDRERREIEHMIGLEKQRMEAEKQAHEKDVAMASREANISVREDALKASQERFQEQLKFNNDRYEKTEGYIKDLMAEIMSRLPNVNVKLRDNSSV